jgi:hypothetical protein
MGVSGDINVKTLSESTGGRAKTKRKTWNGASIEINKYERNLALYKRKRALKATDSEQRCKKWANVYCTRPSAVKAHEKMAKINDSHLLPRGDVGKPLNFVHCVLYRMVGVFFTRIICPI